MQRGYCRQTTVKAGRLLHSTATTHFSNDFASANGATSTQPGAAPRVADATFEEGLKARLNRGFLTDRKIESGLQPSNHFTPSTRGVAPGGGEVAPLALETTR
jgi:hypothetical protein